MMRALLFFLLLTYGPVVAIGQSFNLHVQLPEDKRLPLVLSLYDSDDTPRRMTALVKEGVANFTGTLKAPCYAELRFARMQQVLPLFLESGEIHVRFNVENPELSAVTGSRTNSQYRYLLEQCGMLDVPCVQQALEQYPDQPFSSFLLYRCLQHAQLPLDEQQALFSLLQGAATKSYHYRLLATRLKQASDLQPGKPLPELSFTDAAGQVCPLSKRIDRERPNLLLVGATWCSQCNQMAQRIPLNYPQINLIWLDLDREPQKWDAPYMQALGIDHIPFLLLLDTNGHIVQYDLREWQLDNLLPVSAASNSKTEQ